MITIPNPIRTILPYFLVLALGSIMLQGTSSVAGAELRADHWVATDALGRTLPSYYEVGPVREDKIIGVFYYLWNGTHGNRVYDISEIINQPPESRQWGPSPAFHFWGEPEYGYYRSEDPWVLRRDLQMLSNAKVDFLYFDTTNAVPYLNVVRALCEVSRQMRAEGIKTPEITFTTNTRSGETMNLLYDEFYSKNEYSELWFRWNGKPLMLGDTNDPELRPEVRDFFTIRRSWVGSPNTSQMENHWPWLNWTPQSWGWSGNPDNREQVAVSVAFHPQNPRGQSWTMATEQPPVDESYNTEFTGQGLHAQEQWERALEVDPQVIMVSQWNEWLAQRFIWDRGDGEYGGRPISDGDSWFVDVFSQEFNRDMAPMKGGHTDSMYYQLVSNIRRFKGMEPPPAFSQPKTISISRGNFSQWNDVYPIFWDPEDDVMDRNHSGYDTRVTLVNTTGRNDIIESRVTHDGEHVYFYVKTAEPLTHYSGDDWMLLFIDADGNNETGWEGYDYLVNHSIQDEQTTTISRWRNGSWEVFAAIDYRVEGAELHLEIPRELIRQFNDRVHFHFKWADNIQGVDDIENFFLYGDVAPDRRFNYVYDNTGMPYEGEISVIEFDFDQGALQGWTEASADGQGRQYFALVPPSVSSPNTTPHSGSYFIGLHIPAFGGEPSYTQDSPHDTLVMRSPEFRLNGSGDLTAWLSGGGSGSVSLAGTSVASLPAVSSTDGFLGVALRNVTTGTFVLSASKSGGGNEWEQVTFTAAQLDGLPQEDVYTLDLIDARHGGWGWVNIDSVTIPGTLVDEPVGPNMPMLMIQSSGENAIRLAWPAAATGWTLQRSPEAGGGYTDADLPVSIEGDENVVYDTILSDRQFYRLAR